MANSWGIDKIRAFESTLPVDPEQPWLVVRIEFVPNRDNEVIKPKAFWCGLN